MRNIAALLAVTVLCTPALAQPNDRGRGHDGGNADHNGDHVGLDIVGVAFGPDVEVEIRSYFASNPWEPQGLPPGIAMNLARGKPLPPGIAKRYLPDDLLGRLPAYPNHEIVVVDDDVLLVAVATMVIVDVLSDVL